MQSGTPTDTGCKAPCNDKPITVCTSLPPLPDVSIPGSYTFQENCRFFAEQVCRAVVFAMEEHALRSKTKSFPGATYAEWAKLTEADLVLQECRKLPPNDEPQENAIAEQDARDAALQKEIESDPSLTPRQAALIAEMRRDTLRTVFTAARRLAAHEIDDWGQK
ncbi:MAG: hypothetical protein AAGH64_12315 [Planctomycetota bacterium]